MKMHRHIIVLDEPNAIRLEEKLLKFATFLDICGLPLEAKHSGSHMAIYFDLPEGVGMPPLFEVK